MTKLQKVLLLSLIFVLSISTFAFATEIQPRTVEEPVTTSLEPETTSTESDIMPISETEAEPINETEETTEEPEILYKDVFLFDEKVVLDDLVDGNAFIMGSEVTISGEINGDLYVIAEELTIEENSFIYSSLYVIANKITLNGAAYDLYGIAETFEMGGTNSYVYRDLNLMANDVTINGYVNRNANISAQSIVLGYPNGPTIIGDLNYTAPYELMFDENAVYGDTNFTPEPEIETETETDFLSILISALYEIAFLFIVFVLASLITPKFVKRSGEYVSSLKLLHATWIGLVATIVLIVVEGILLVFLPQFSLVLILLTIAAVLLANPVLAIGISSAVTRKANIENIVLKALINLIAAIVITALPLIPVVGWVFAFVTYIMGFGLMILYLFDSERRGKNKEKKVKTEKVKETLKTEEVKKIEKKEDVKVEEKQDKKDDKKTEKKDE